MTDNNRRRLLQTAALGSVAALAATALPDAAAADETDREYPLTDRQCDWTAGERLDYRNIRIAGFTHDEAICWLLTARAAGAFFNLPEQHPADIPEVVTAVHTMQYKLLGRPTYREYIEAYEGGTNAMTAPPQAS